MWKENVRLCLVERARCCMHNHLGRLKVRLLEIQLTLCVCVCVCVCVCSSCRRAPLACWRWLCKLSCWWSRVNVGNRGLCLHRSNFFRACDWFCPPAELDARRRCETIPLGGELEEKRSMRLDWVMSALTAAVGCYQKHVSSSCVSAVFVSLDLEYFEHFFSTQHRDRARWWVLELLPRHDIN